MRRIVIANSAAQVAGAVDNPANRATTAMASPHTISPTYSAWARKECTVARTSALVSVFTKMVPIVRVRGRAIPARAARPR